MRKVYVTLEVHVCLQVEGDVDIKEAIDNLEISARPCEDYLDDVDVLDATVIDYTITDVK
jgi:hypothetical protein